MMAVMGIRDNLRREIKSRFGTQARFAEAIGLSGPRLSEVLSGDRLNEKWLEKISAVLGIPVYQLFADEPLVPRSYAEKEPTIFYCSSIREEPASYGLRETPVEAVPLFEDTLSLGPGHEISQYLPEDFIPLPRKFMPKGFRSDPNRIVAFPVTGISMRPTINDGSIVWIDRQDIEPVEGRIYAFWLEATNQVTIKRLLKIDRYYCIIDGDNRNEEDRKTEGLRGFPMVLECKRSEGVEIDVWPIRGRVIWALNRLIEKASGQGGG